jgi:signal transduction histidine kinase
LTEALASRVAGLKLGGIVAVLLLPMALLSALMVASLRGDMALVQRELLGAELNRLVMPVAIGAATGERRDADIAALRSTGRPIALELGIKQKFDGALASLLTYTADMRFAVQALADLQVESANASRIVLDAGAETNHLGVILSYHAPRLLSEFVRAWTFASLALRDSRLSPDEAATLLAAAGSWQESQQRILTAMTAAAAAAADPQAYSDALATAAELRGHPNRVVKVFARNQLDDVAAELAKVPELGTGARGDVEAIASLWRFAARRFEDQLAARYGAMRLKLFTLLAIALAACVVAVGGAALMFRSTLRQLDDVKQSRDDADRARREAESAAAEVSRINDDVVRLNTDLARNLAMLREAQDENLRKSKMAQLGQLTATVAHELRNPLGAVRTSAFLLARKVKDRGLGIEPQIERINNGVTRCDNIISQLLEFARSKAIQPETAAFDPWLASFIEDEAQRLPGNIVIDCRLGLGDTPVAFDPTRIGRAIANLLSNASEALTGRPEEPGRMSVRNPQITITTARSERGIEVTVADNGPGIAAEHLDKIFEPLFTTKNFGTGLGLPAAEKILQQHGGGIEVASPPGHGARFTIWWPIQSAERQVA